MRAKFTDESSIREVIGQMTLKEKANFITMAHEVPNYTYAIEDMDILPLTALDGATGVNGTNQMMDFIVGLQKEGGGDGDKAALNPWVDLQALLGMEKAEAAKAAEGSRVKQDFLKFLEEKQNPAGRYVSFPSGVNVGACFDEERAYKIGKAVGEEMRASHVDICFGPNVDIIRDPLGGRNYEMYGEDPMLVGRTAAAFVRGVQSTGTAACAKHFIANNQETRRATKDTHVSKRTLRELYAKGFEKAVKEGGVKAVMSAYNAVNGKFSSYNKELLTDWLKDEWGFDGVVFSDSGAVTGHNDRAVAAGLDMVLHGATTECDNEDIVEAVKDGTLDLARLDDAVVRFLKLILWQRKAREENPYIYDQKKLLQCAYDTAVDGMVLLKNESVLPLDKSKKVVLFGSRAKSTMECGGGSTYVTTPLHGNLFDEFAKVGVDVAGKEDADIAIYAAGAEGGENADRPGMKLDKEDEGRIADVLKREKEQGRKTVVVLNVAGPVEMSDWIANADAVLVNFIPGCMGAKATTDVLLGEENPGGKLPVTFPIRLEDSPAAPYPIGEHDDVYYGEGIFVGYRWYDYKGLPVQYPFGFGLSYTDFEICAEDAPGSWNIKEEEKFQVRVKVKNVGKRFGSEVVQLYMRPKTARIPMPERELKAFSKVFLEPSEENTVTLTVKKEDLEVCDPERGMLIPIGEYEVELGTSSRDMFHCFTLEVEGENPYVFDEHSTLGEILANEEAMAVLGRYIPGMAEGIASMTPDMLKFMESEKIGPLLSRQMIRAISDTNELKAILDRLFAELAQVGNEGKVV